MHTASGASLLNSRRLTEVAPFLKQPRFFIRFAARCDFVT